jgi:hypothetical protein
MAEGVSIVPEETTGVGVPDELPKSQAATSMRSASKQNVRASLILQISGNFA